MAGKIHEHRRPSLRSRLWAAIDWFVPEKLRAASEDTLQQSRLLIGFVAVLMIAGATYASAYIMIGSLWNVVTLSGGVLAGPWLLLLFRRTGSMTLAGNIALGVTAAALTLQSFALAGPVGPTAIWFPILPLLAMTLLGQRAAVRWTAVTSAILSVLVMLDVLGHEFRNDVAHIMAFWMYVSMLGLILAVLTLTRVYVLTANRKSAQLSEEMEFSQTAVDSLPGIFFVLDERGRLQRWNRNLEAMVGITGDRLAGLKFAQAATTSTRREMLQWLRHIINEGELTLEQTVRNPRGDAARYYFTARRMMIDGRPHIIGTGLDISERKRAEESLQASEEKLARANQMLKLVLDTIPVGVFWKDGDGCYLGCNRCFAHIAGGYSVEEIIGRDDYAMPWRDIAADCQAIDRDVMVSGKPLLGREERLVTIDGRTIWLRKDKVPLFDSNGNVFGVLGICEDVSERNRAAAAVEESERRFHNIIRNSPMGFYLYEIDRADRLILIDANSAADRQTGMNSRALIGKPLEEAFPGLVGTRLSGRFRAAARDGESWHEANVLCEDDKIQGHYDVHVFQVSPGRAAVMFLDVTDRFRVETELRERAGQLEELNTELVAQRQELVAQRQELTAHQAQLSAVNAQLAEASRAATAANRTKSEFLANMSHEIRTPMTAILGFADVILESEDRANTEVLEAADTIRRNGEYLLSLINEILDLSKIEAGKFRIEQTQYSPCELMEEVATLMRPRAADKNLTFAIRHENPIPHMIQTDPLRLKQILINLVGNAIKFTELGGIEIITRFVAIGAKGRLEFDVVDTGIGMTGKQMQRLFQPFEQADTSTSRRFGGTGLGLTVSKRIAEILGGDIMIIASEPGGGSRFRASIATGAIGATNWIEAHGSPIITREAMAELAPHNNDSALQDLRILLAEDGVDNQRLISHILRKAGAEAVLAENGQIATEVALQAERKGRPFDVILMDMQMPVMDGYEATALLRWQGYTGTIIALTAHAMAHDRDKCLQAGCDDYASKPVQRSALIESILACVAAKQSAKAISESPAT